MASVSRQKSLKSTKKNNTNIWNSQFYHVATFELKRTKNRRAVFRGLIRAHNCQTCEGSLLGWWIPYGTWNSCYLGVVFWPHARLLCHNWTASFLWNSCYMTVIYWPRARLFCLTQQLIEGYRVFIAMTNARILKKKKKSQMLTTLLLLLLAQ